MALPRKFRVVNTGRSVRATKSEIVRMNGAQRAVRVVPSIKFVFRRYHSSTLETPPKAFPETGVIFTHCALSQASCTRREKWTYVISRANEVDICFFTSHMDLLLCKFSTTVGKYSHNNDKSARKSVSPAIISRGSLRTHACAVGRDEFLHDDPRRRFS